MRVNTEPNARVTNPAGAPGERIVSLVFFVSGAAGLIFEVVWFRFLSMFVINSTLAVSVMLAVVLAAIGVGGLAASSWLKRSPQAPAYLPAVALAAGCVSAVSYQAFQFLTTGTQVAEWYRILWNREPVHARVFSTHLRSAG